MYVLKFHYIISLLLSIRFGNLPMDKKKLSKFICDCSFCMKRASAGKSSSLSVISFNFRLFIQHVNYISCKNQMSCAFLLLFCASKYILFKYFLNIQPFCNNKKLIRVTVDFFKKSGYPWKKPRNFSKQNSGQKISKNGMGVRKSELSQCWRSC